MIDEPWSCPMCGVRCPLEQRSDFDTPAGPISLCDPCCDLVTPPHASLREVEPDG